MRERSCGKWVLGYCGKWVLGYCGYWLTSLLGAVPSCQGIVIRAFCLVAAARSETWTSAPPAGCVFLAFGFNWVDCGGLLGGRLDEDVALVPKAAKALAAAAAAPAGAHHAKPEVKRTRTM